MENPHIQTSSSHTWIRMETPGTLKKIKIYFGKLKIWRRLVF
jgi:hypothetical protein